jgi:hypothetical protein
MTTWRGQGKGKFTGPGKVSFRGSVFLKIPPVVEGGKLSILNKWWECLNTRLTRMEIAPLKRGSGNRKFRKPEIQP